MDAAGSTPGPASCAPNKDGLSWWMAVGTPGSVWPEQTRGIYGGRRGQKGRYIDQIGHSSDAGRQIGSELHFGLQQRGSRLCSTAPHRGGPAPPAAAARPQSTPSRETSWETLASHTSWGPRQHTACSSRRHLTARGNLLRDGSDDSSIFKSANENWNQVSPKQGCYSLILSIM